MARACLKRLEAGAMKRRIDELRTRVKSAEREGEVEKALAWMGQNWVVWRRKSRRHTSAMTGESGPDGCLYTE